jgi:hypothetical protein
MQTRLRSFVKGTNAYLARTIHSALSPGERTNIVEHHIVQSQANNCQFQGKLEETSMGGLQNKSLTKRVLVSLNEKDDVDFIRPRDSLVIAWRGA